MNLTKLPSKIFRLRANQATAFQSPLSHGAILADDMKISLEKGIKALDAEIKLRKAEAKKMFNLEAKVKAQRQIKELEKKRSDKRQTLFETQDQIDKKKRPCSPISRKGSTIKSNKKSYSP